ncbi:MAG: hypothetical protein IJ685_09245 [Selenomonadaceae bacterium]|nr:hypothetical protein [Selenomonadaceae bacterium]
MFDGLDPNRLLPFILAGICLCVPSPAISTVWLTGACNYLWMCTAIILFLLPNAQVSRRRFFC